MNYAHKNWEDSCPRSQSWELIFSIALEELLGINIRQIILIDRKGKFKKCIVENIDNSYK